MRDGTFKKMEIFIYMKKKKNYLSSSIKEGLTQENHMNMRLGTRTNKHCLNVDFVSLSGSFKILRWNMDNKMSKHRSKLHKSYTQFLRLGYF